MIERARASARTGAAPGPHGQFWSPGGVHFVPIGLSKELNQMFTSLFIDLSLSPFLIFVYIVFHASRDTAQCQYWTDTDSKYVGGNYLSPGE